MFIMDGRRRIRKLWGGYSPKLYDGDFLNIQREFFAQHFSGTAVVGDGHFEKGPTFIPSVEWLVPTAKPRGRKKKGESEPIELLSRKQQQMNKEIRDIRSRLESPFGNISNMFTILEEAWREEEKQLEDLVFFAAGYHNSTL